MLCAGVEESMRTTFASGLLALALGAGCGAGVGYRGTVTVSASTPDLAYVAPGVQVIADYDEPIFFANGYYWWFYDGLWYSSPTYTGGWAFVSRPPVAIARIRDPFRFRRFRPQGYVVRRRPVPTREVRRPVVRRSQVNRDRDRDRDGVQIRDHR
jgi:hypothetical protein